MNGPHLVNCIQKQRKMPVRVDRTNTAIAVQPEIVRD
jgi:hypothetical protein